jgi:hypothetical protein
MLRPPPASLRHAPIVALFLVLAAAIGAPTVAPAATAPPDAALRRALDRLRVEAPDVVEAVVADDGRHVVTMRGALTPPGPEAPRVVADRFLARNAALYGGLADLSDLRLESSQASPAGRHLRYRQTWGGLPVFDAGVDVHLSTTGGVFLMHNRFVPGLALETAATLTAAEAGGRARDRFARTRRPGAGPAVLTTVAVADLGIAGGGDAASAARPAAPRLAWRIVLRSAEPAGAREYLIDARTGAVVRDRDLAVDGHVTGSGRVFDPNPVAYLGDPTLRDNNDADGPGFAPAYLEVALTGLSRMFSDRFGPVTLSGPHVRVTDLIESPYLANVTSPDGRFLFTRDQDGFEAVMAYFHIDRTQRYIQSLGFTSVNNRQIRVDPHGLRGAQNAHYVGFPFGRGWISFGTGGVDLAEDADVIWHEYGHAMQDNQNPGAYTFVGEVGAQGEGFGDYWASVNSVLTNPSLPDPECIGEWAFEGVCLRRTDGTRHYPEDIEGEVHADGEIWSALLRDVAIATGPEVANRIILESHFLVPMFPRFCAGAAALRDADDTLYGGAHRDAVTGAAAVRGIAADLAPTGITATPGASTGDLVRFTITNQGPCGAGAVSASVRRVVSVTGSEVEVAAVALDPLAARGSVETTLSLPGIPGASYLYRVVVDPAGAEAETDESNNSLDSAEIAPAP